MGIRKQLIAILTVFCFGLILVGVSSLYSTQKLGSSLATVIDESVPHMQALTLIDMVHDVVRGCVMDGVLAASLKSKERLDAAKQDLADHKENVAKHFKLVTALVNSGPVEEAEAKGKKDMDEYLASAEHVMELVGSAPFQTVLAELEKFQVKFEALEKSLSALAELAEGENKTYFSSVVAFAGRVQLALTIAFLVSLLIGASASVFVIRRLSLSLNEVSAGLSRGANAVSSSVTQLSAASEDLSAASTQQSAALQQTSAAIDEISAMVKRSADNAVEAEQNSEASRQKAENGQNILKEMAQAMDVITQSNDAIAREMMQTNEKTSEILQVIQEIGSKTKVINDIVFQTKLLSFNASVEAARAGEHGKGFAVVAEEVGNLAQMSGNAAKEIRGLLESSMENVKAIVEGTKGKVETLVATAKGTVEQGNDVARKCAAVLMEIVSASTSVSEMVSDISTANQEQAKGVEEISKALHQLDKATHVNTRASQNCADSAKALSKQVSDLRHTSSALGLLVEGRYQIARFEWKNDYLLGVDSMDAEHKVLVSRINCLAEALESGSKQSLKKAFLEMAQFTKGHFGREEKFMTSIGYPDLANHQEIHRDLLAKVGAFGADIERDQLDAPKLMGFLNDWLIKHILGVDMKYAKHSRESHPQETKRRAA